MVDIKKNIINIMDQYLLSTIVFNNYIETSGILNNLENCNFDYIKLMLISLELSIWKNKFKSKDSFKQALLNIDSKLFNNTMQIISEKKSTSWKIGEIYFDDCYELIDRIYKKITRGDFTLNNGVFQFCIGEEKASININDLSNFCHCLSITFQNSNKNIISRLPIGINTIKTNEMRYHISNKSSLKYIVDHFYYVEIFDEPIVPRVRDHQYEKIINTIYPILINLIKERINKKDFLSDVELLVTEFNNYLEQYGIKLFLSIKQSKDIQGKEILFKIYNSMRKEFNQADLATQIKYINNVLFSLADHTYGKLDFNSAILLEKSTLNTLEIDRTLTLSDLIKKDNRDDYKNLVISTYLSNFYAIYMYGLNLAFVKDDISIRNIYAGNVLDFSKLDLSKFNPNIINRIEVNDEFIKELESIQKEYDIANKEYEKAKSVYDNYLDENKHRDISTMAQTLLILKQKINDSRRKLNNIERLLDFSNKFVENIELFDRNKQLIEQISECIINGDIYVYPYDNEDIQNDTKIVFRNMKRGNIEFELTISLSDFITLFNSSNINEIINFITLNKVKNDTNIKKLTYI